MNRRGALRLMAGLATVAVLAAAVLSAEDDAPRNQASNSKLKLEGRVFPRYTDVQQALGFSLGEGYVVVQLRATPKTLNPLRLSGDQFTLISRKNGERSSALAPEDVASHADIQATLKVRGFPDVDSKDPVEGLLYFQLAGKLSPKDLGLVYQGPAGHLVIDFK